MGDLPELRSGLQPGLKAEGVMKSNAARTHFEERTSPSQSASPVRDLTSTASLLQRFVEFADCFFFVAGGTLCELTEFLTCFTHTAVVAVEMK